MGKRFLVGIHRLSFRPGTPAEIMGVETVTPKGWPARECYRVRFEDGIEDLVPCADFWAFVIVSEEDVRAGNLPKVSP